MRFSSHDIFKQEIFLYDEIIKKSLTIFLNFQALMKKLGEKEWATLTEKERQRRIMQIKQKEKKLRRQGKYDDLAKLFQNLAITEQGKF